MPRALDALDRVLRSMERRLDEDGAGKRGARCRTDAVRR